MRTKLFTTFILVLLAASACGPQSVQQAPFAAGSQAWIDAPLPGSQLPLAPVEIVAHATGTGGIASFRIALNGQPLATTPPDAASLDPAMVHTRYTWQPSAPGTYLIEVTAYGQDEQPGPTVRVSVEVVETTPTPLPTETATPTSIPTLTLTPTCGPLMFTPNLNAFCRQGPGVVFAPLEEPAMQGVGYLMDGRNLDGSWYRIMLSASQGCWVPAGVGTPSCDPGQLRVLADVPTPVTTCSTFTDRATCEAQTACQWKVTLAGPGLCVNK